MELHHTRAYTQHGPRPLAFGEIHAWATLTRCALLPVEVEWLRALDEAYIEHEREKAMPTTASTAHAASSEATDDAAEDEDDDDGDHSPA